MNVLTLALFSCGLLLCQVLEAQSTPEGWSRYFARDSSYSVLMPQPVYERQDTIVSDFGLLIQRTIFSQDTARLPQVTFSISEYHYPDGVIQLEDDELNEAFFSSTISGSLDRLKGILDYRNREKFKGFPACIWRVTYAGNTKVMRHKAVLRAHSLLLLQVAMPVKNSSSRISDLFVQSLQFP